MSNKIFIIIIIALIGAFGGMYYWKEYNDSREQKRKEINKLTKEIREDIKDIFPNIKPPVKTTLEQDKKAWNLALWKIGSELKNDLATKNTHSKYGDMRKFHWWNRAIVEGFKYDKDSIYIFTFKGGQGQGSGKAILTVRVFNEYQHDIVEVIENF